MSENIPGTSTGSEEESWAFLEGKLDEHVLYLQSIGISEPSDPSRSRSLRNGYAFQSFNKPKRKVPLIDENLGEILVNETTMKQSALDMDDADTQLQFMALNTTRKILTKDQFPPIDLTIQAGIVPRCVQFLRNELNAVLQYEAALILTVVTSGNTSQTRAVADAGVVDALNTLMGSRNERLALQALHILGNIIGDGPTLRDFVIGGGVLPRLVAVANSAPSDQYWKSVAWLMSNIFRCNNPPPALEVVEQCRPILDSLLYMADKKLDSDVCLAFSFITLEAPERFQELVTSAVVLRFVELLDYGFDYKQYVVDAQVGLRLKKLLNSTNGDVVRLAVWVLFNITTGTTEQIAEIVHVTLVPRILELIGKGTPSVRKYAAEAIANITSTKMNKHMLYLSENNLVPPMLKKLQNTDPATTLAILTGIQNMLNGAWEFDLEKHKDIASAIEKSGGSKVMEQVQANYKDNSAILNHVNTILDVLKSYQ